MFNKLVIAASVAIGAGFTMTTTTKTADAYFNVGCHYVALDVHTGMQVADGYEPRRTMREACSDAKRECENELAHKQAKGKGEGAQCVRAVPHHLHHTHHGHKHHHHTH